MSNSGNNEQSPPNIERRESIITKSAPVSLPPKKDLPVPHPKESSPPSKDSPSNPKEVQKNANPPPRRFSKQISPKEIPLQNNPPRRDIPLPQHVTNNDNLRRNSTPNEITKLNLDQNNNNQRVRTTKLPQKLGKPNSARKESPEPKNLRLKSSTVRHAKNFIDDDKVTLDRNSTGFQPKKPVPKRIPTKTTGVIPMKGPGESCFSCKKPVIPSEKIFVDGKVFHKICQNNK